MFTVK